MPDTVPAAAPPPLAVEAHRLVASGRPVRQTPALDVRGPMFEGPIALCLHYGAGTQASDVAALTRADDAYISAHLSLGRDGTWIQMVPFDTIALHCGDGAWKPRGRAGPAFSGRALNGRTIGVEIENIGWMNRTDGLDCWREERWQGRVARTARWPASACRQAVHALRGGPAAWWLPYTDAQHRALDALIAALKAAYPIRFLFGHDEISAQKWDPGPLLDLEALRRRHGLAFD
jgi:N-acetylmuramoyl-L-alanine amidase